jgi:dTDP-4-dehydrorhamnose 3,5-epimerase
MKSIKTPLQDLLIIQSDVFSDSRGSFQKIFNSQLYKDLSLDFDLKEFYYSISHKNVIRGLHFQIPPHDHTKLVFVSQGEILDVVVDLRKDSATFGKLFSTRLNSSDGNSLFIPSGFAHGFLSLTDNTIVNYMQTSQYHKESDSGILFSSIDFDWGVSNPIVSERDLSFVSFDQFKTPF